MNKPAQSANLDSDNLDADNEVVFYYRMGEADPAADDSARVATTVADAAVRLSQPLTFMGTPRYTEDVAASVSRRAVCFGPADTATAASANGFGRIPENWVLEAWARADVASNAVIAYVGNSGRNGFGLYLRDGEWKGLLGGKQMIQGTARCELGTWTHLALVCENGRIWLLVNGLQTGLESNVLPTAPEDRIDVGGHCENTKEVFHGAIDEVRLMELKQPLQLQMLLWKPPPSAPPPRQ